MKVAIQMSAVEEAKALPILLRHSPGVILPNRTCVISADAAKSLREAGVSFSMQTDVETPFPTVFRPAGECSNDTARKSEKE